MNLYTVRNISQSPTFISTASIKFPPNLLQISVELTRAFIFLLIPGELFYFSIYFLLKRHHRLHNFLTFLSLMTLWVSPVVTPVKCHSSRSMLNLVVFVASMKTLDLWARRHALPNYKIEKKPPDWLLSLLLMTELRYESFVPNYVRLPKGLENVNQTREFCIHAGALIALNSISGNHPTVLAFEILLSIHVFFTSIHLMVGYKNSPPLFAPLYSADSLTGFWSEVWHNSFTSPCMSLAYYPLRNSLLKLGLSDQISRSVGILGAFCLMAVFHMYCLYPVLDLKAMNRVGLFFFINGIATLFESAIWGNKRHWTRALLAWIFQTFLATWVASSLNIQSNYLKTFWYEYRMSLST